MGNRGKDDRDDDLDLISGGINVSTPLIVMEEVTQVHENATFKEDDLGTLGDSGVGVANSGGEEQEEDGRVRTVSSCSYSYSYDERDNQDEENGEGDSGTIGSGSASLRTKYDRGRSPAAE